MGRLNTDASALFFSNYGSSKLREERKRSLWAAEEEEAPGVKCMVRIYGGLIRVKNLQCFRASLLDGVNLDVYIFIYTLLNFTPPSFLVERVNQDVYILSPTF